MAHFPYRGAAAVGILALTLLAGPALAGTPAESCAALAGLKIPAGEIGLPTTGARVTSARLVGPVASPTHSAPEHCEVLGAIDPVDPAAPAIHFALDLPSAWNGKALMFGGGGFDGTVPEVAGPALALPPDRVLTPLLRGYATFGSDSGHQALPSEAPIPAVDAVFAMNDEALANFAGDALKKTRDAAVRVMMLAYGRAPARTYFAGGSNGGREGLLVTQRWPGDFDGVIAAFPFWNAGTTALTFGTVMNGFSRPGAYVGPAKQALLFDAVVGACDGLDGLKDGVVSNVAACRFDPVVLRCPSGAEAGDTCLSDPQIEALRRYDAPVTYGYRTTGKENSYPGWPVFAGADLRGDQQMASTPPVHPAVASMPTIAHFWDQLARYAIARDPAFNALTLDPEHPGKYAARINKVVDLLDSRSTELGPFAARGGKLVIYQGLADPIVSPRSTAAYWERLEATLGKVQVAAFARFYVAPGYGHGRAGLSAFDPSWDALSALEGWVEQGRAPGDVVATDISATGHGRTRPLCAYGSWPRYDGRGDPNAAASFTCEAAATR